jgi:hypothetical protein
MVPEFGHFHQDEVKFFEYLFGWVLHETSEKRKTLEFA